MNVIQVVSATANSNVVSATLVATAAHSLIVVSSWWDNTGRTFTSITDNKAGGSSVYTNAANTAGSTTQAERIDYTSDSASGITTVTLTLNGSANCGIVVYEIGSAERSTSRVLGNTNVANSTSATTLNCLLSTSDDFSIVISGFCNGDTSVDTAHSNGMIVDVDVTATGGGRLGAGSQIFAAKQTARDFGWTTAGAATVWAICVAEFRARLTPPTDGTSDVWQGANSARQTLMFSPLQFQDEWTDALPVAPPPVFDPAQFIQVETDQQITLRFIAQEVDDDWPTLLPAAPPVTFDASLFIQVETDVKPTLIFSSQDVDDWPDVLPVTPPPPFDATQLPQVDETQLAFKTLVRYEDAPDVFPIFLPPFIHELQEFPKLPSNYVWLSVTWEDWLQPPAGQIVNSGPAFGRSVRLGLMFPAFR